MTDKELLELAAKALGCEYSVHHFGGDDYGLLVNEKWWNPLADDGEALRLAVILKLWVQVNHTSIEVELWQDDFGETKNITEYVDPECDFHAATRRAIVRAAAEIGKSK